MDKLIERIVKAPLGAKIGASAAIVVALAALNFFVVSAKFGPSISTMEDGIRRAQVELVKLEREYIEKTAIANNLNQFRREKEVLEQQLRDALSELPEEKNIEALLPLFEDRARKAGLEIGSIEPGKIVT